MRKIHPRFKLWLNSGKIEGAFGDGKWRLLDAIEALGSLRAASQSLGISYRKAWGDLQKTQTALGVTLVEKHRGGKTGGRTVLTDQGRKWVNAYAAFRGDIEEAVAKAFGRHFAEANE
jgi:molybdate transport system regulatory protein